MCNFAVNSITFSSKNQKLLKNLHGKIMKCYQTRRGNLVRNLLINHGYEEPLIASLVNKTDHFSDCDNFIVRKDNVYTFSCETTTSWRANISPFLKLLSDCYQNSIHISFISEEPGNEQFVVFDESGMFYPERYRVDWCLNGEYETEYFSSFKETINYLKYHFPDAEFGYYDRIIDIKRSIDEAYSERDSDYFFNFNKFQEFEYTPYEYYNQEAC